MTVGTKDEFWVYGGMDDGGTYYSDFWHFQVATLTWTLLSSGDRYTSSLLYFSFFIFFDIINFSSLTD